MANRDIEVNNLIINELTKAEFDSAAKSETELYFVTDDKVLISEVDGLQSALDSKQEVVDDLDTIRDGASKGATAYQKPSTGIPEADLASAVQTSLGKANTALQSFTETDPTVPAHVKSITSANISSWNGKQEALVSGTNIKTINGESILGSGNMEIKAGSDLDITRLYND